MQYYVFYAFYLKKKKICNKCSEKISGKNLVKWQVKKMYKSTLL